MSAPGSRPSLPWIIAALALASGLGLWLGARWSQPAASGPHTEAALVYPEPRPVPEFELVRGDGSAFARDDLKGAWSVMFFGYTHCPDVCPVTLALYKELETLLQREPAATPVKLVFVSVDPARDDAKALAAYAGYFSPSIVAATGPDDQLEPLTRALGVVYARNAPDARGDYTVDHSAGLLLVDPEARLHALIRPPLAAQAIAADIRALAKER
jgi:protein SCO1/2